jgi:hypothetical protein
MARLGVHGVDFRHHPGALRCEILGLGFIHENQTRKGYC